MIVIENRSMCGLYEWCS